MKFDRYEALPAKPYNALLKDWEEVHEPGWNKITKKYDGEVERKLRFTFALKTKNGIVERTLDRYPSIGKNSKLVMLLKAVAPDKLTDEILKDDEKLTTLLNLLRGKKCVVVITHNEKGYDKIDSVQAAPDESDEPPVAKFKDDEEEEAEVDSSDLAEDDDTDIPF